MEVSKRALGLLATMAIVLTAWLVARDSASGNPQLRARSRERIAAIALADSVSRLGRLVRAREVRSLVEASIERQPQLEHASVLVIGGGLADTLAPLTDSLLATLELPAAAHVPLRLVLVEAPRQWPAHRAYVHTFTLLPDSTQDSSCTAVRVVWADRIEAEEERLDWQRLPWHGAVGPCWYLAQFGMPGPAIRTWLDARYWDVAGVVPPHARREAFRSSLEYSPGLIGRLLGDLGSGYFGGSATLVSCASDRPSLCEAALLDSPYRVGAASGGNCRGRILAEGLRPPAVQLADRRALVGVSGVALDDGGGLGAHPLCLVLDESSPSDGSLRGRGGDAVRRMVSESVAAGDATGRRSPLRPNECGGRLPSASWPWRSAPRCGTQSAGRCDRPCPVLRRSHEDPACGGTARRGRGR